MPEDRQIKMNNEERYYSKGNLKTASGWTDKLINELLGEPDYIKEDWCCGTVLEGGAVGSKVWRRTRYYLDSRVEAAEQTEVFRKGRKKLPWEILAEKNASVGAAN